MMQDGGRSPGAKASEPWCLWPGAEWNVTVESYVVHTNYDEYAIFLTKKNSRHHGPTITAKLYGEDQRQGGPGAGWVGAVEWEEQEALLLPVGRTPAGGQHLLSLEEAGPRSPGGRRPSLDL